VFSGCRQCDFRIDAVTGHAPVLLWQEVHGEMHAIEFSPWHFQVARLFRPAGQCHGIEVFQQLADRRGDTDVCIGVKGDTFRSHLLHAPVDDVLFHLEIRNAVAQQAANAIGFFEQLDRMACACQLLRTRQTGRTGADHGHALAGLVRGRQWLDPALFPALVDDGAFNGLDGDRRIVDVQRAGLFARRRADAAGKFREVVGRLQNVERFLPVAPVHQVIPVGDDVVDRAALVTERDAAIHAARTLQADFLVPERYDKFTEMLDALLGRCVFAVMPLVFHETGWFAHAQCLPPTASSAVVCAVCISCRARR
jgi:hypothetical protein